MLKRFRNSLTTTIVGLFLVVAPTALVAAVPAVAYASTTNLAQQEACGSNQDLSGSTGCDSDTSQGTSGISNIIKTVINVFSAIVGIVSVIMIIYGGFRYVTSGGDSGHVSSAKNTIIYAIVGLVVVALAQFIVQYVLNQVSQVGQ